MKCLMDAASNMTACAKALQIRHCVCIAHGLNLLVCKSFDQICAFSSSLGTKAKKIVTYFCTSTTGKERPDWVQMQMGRQPQKLIMEVDTRWNSTYLMLERLFKLREPVAADLATLKADVSPLTSHENETIEESLPVLAPFHQATAELSEERWVSISKAIP